jgi:hypothetical protein
MSIESVEFGYTEKDTSILVKYIEDGEEKTITVESIWENGIFQSNETEEAIRLTIYGNSLIPEIPSPSE